MRTIDTNLPADFEQALSKRITITTDLGRICYGGKPNLGLEKLVLDTTFPEPGYYITNIANPVAEGTAEVFCGGPVWVSSLETYACWCPSEAKLWLYPEPNLTWEKIEKNPRQYIYTVSGLDNRESWQLIIKNKPSYSSYERIQMQAESRQLIEDEILPFIAHSSREAFLNSIVDTPSINLKQIKEYNRQFRFLISAPYNVKLCDIYEAIYMCKLMELLRRQYKFKVGANRKLHWVAEFLFTNLCVLEFLAHQGKALNPKLLDVYDILVDVFTIYHDPLRVKAVQDAWHRFQQQSQHTDWAEDSKVCA